MDAWYDRFETLNDQFIKAVSDWQKSDEDEKAESKVIKIVERLIKAMGELTAGHPALRRIMSGGSREGIGAGRPGRTGLRLRPDASIPSIRSGSSFMRTSFPSSAVLATSEERRDGADPRNRPSSATSPTPKSPTRSATAARRADLSRMVSAGVPVPPAFVIGAEGFHSSDANGETGRRPRSWAKFETRCDGWKHRRAGRSAASSVRCSSPCAPARRSACPE